MSTPNKKKSVFIWWSTSLIFQVKMLEVSWNTSKKNVNNGNAIKTPILEHILSLFEQWWTLSSFDLFVFLLFFFSFFLLIFFFLWKFPSLFPVELLTLHFKAILQLFMFQLSSKSLWPKETELFFFLLIVAIHAFFDYYYYKI